MFIIKQKIISLTKIIVWVYTHKYKYIQVNILVYICIYCTSIYYILAHIVNSASAGDAGDMGSVPWSGRSLGKGNGYPLQYSCLEKSMDRGAWWAIVHGVAKSGTQLKQLSTHRLPKQAKQILMCKWPE